MIERAYLKARETPPADKEYVLVKRDGEGFTVDHRVEPIGVLHGPFETRHGAFVAAEQSASRRGLDLIYAKGVFDA
jgi:hypothetical protein